MKKLLLTIISAIMALSTQAAEPNMVPGTKSQQKLPIIKINESKKTITVENDYLMQEWSFNNSLISPSLLRDKINGKEYSQKKKELFVLSVAPLDPKKIKLRIKITDDTILCQSACAPKGMYKTIMSIPRNSIKGKIKSISLGKLDSRGKGVDYGNLGNKGACQLTDFRVSTAKGRVPYSRLIKNIKARLSPTKGTSLEVKNDTMDVATHANSYAFNQYYLDDEVTSLECSVSKQTDKGNSWGPGLALYGDTGNTVVFSIRPRGAFNITVNGKEHIFNGIPFPSSEFTIVGKPRSIALNTIAGSSKWADSFPGVELIADLIHPESGLKVAWHVQMRKGTNYIIQSFKFSASKPLLISRIQLSDYAIPSMKQIGRVTGSPAAGDGIFLGTECPASKNKIHRGNCVTYFDCKLLISNINPYTFRTVVGSYSKGQLRRDFQKYLEMERARKAKKFLHYNCWYDFGMDPDEKKLTHAIKEFSRELTDKYGVAMDSYVIDEGWDGKKDGFWDIDRERFPNGFDEIKKLLKKNKSHVGLWISPLAGYNATYNQRKKLAGKLGLLKDGKFDLSKPEYKKFFLNKCTELIRDHQTNYFKWDRALTGVNAHSMALFDIASKLRKVDPDVFLNVTVGSWPSPYWLMHVDSIWRNGSDTAGWGKGDERERWITYRDFKTYRNVVRQAPLFPLNSVMNHGLVHGRKYHARDITAAGNDLRNEARSYFACGTKLQELYITPDLMTPESWKQLAEAAKWANEYDDILTDTHWVGGDPDNLNPYGWAAWTENGAVLTLRNPDDKAKEITIDVAKVFELPAKAQTYYKLKSPYADQRISEIKLKAGTPKTIKLNAFEVLVFSYKKK